MGDTLNRAEAVGYGKFVLGAYAMYERDRNKLCPEPQPGDIPDTHELQAWIVMSDFILGINTPTFYGYVARKKTAPEAFILAIRGTENIVEWIDDAFIHLVPFSQVPDAGSVAQGFDKIYSSMQVIPHPDAIGGGAKPEAVPARLDGTFYEQMEQLHARMRNAERARGTAERATDVRPPYHVAGHSLGAALGTLWTMENAKTRNSFAIETLCTFGSPHVGDRVFARLFNLLPLDSWRMANKGDLVPKLPIPIPLILDYEHVATGYEFWSQPGPHKLDLLCCHSMFTYLHWLDAAEPLQTNCQ